MPSPSRRTSNSRPRSKSSISDNLQNSRPNSSWNGSLTLPTSPSLPAGFPSTANTPSPGDTPKTNHTNNNNTSTTTTPRRNGRRRYTPRQIPQSSFRSPPQPSSPQILSPKPSPSETDVAQFVSLTNQLNGQMDGLVDYHLPGGRWER